MTKTEFKVIVGELLSKAQDLPVGDYSSAMRVVNEFEKIAERYQSDLNPFVLEHIGQIKNQFLKARHSVDIGKKFTYHERAVNDLLSDIRSMSENSFSI